MAKKKNYVNNKDLLAALIEYKSKCVEAEESGEKNPQVPDYIGKCIMLIAQRLSTRPNFSGYMYKEEMVSDGIENCLQYIHNFNPEKSQNPFAYFTQIIWYAFLRRISKEKK
jgi:DNA-directed RNA polymerase specialized sigma24 family protein